MRKTLQVLSAKVNKLFTRELKATIVAAHFVVPNLGLYSDAKLLAQNVPTEPVVEQTIETQSIVDTRRVLLENYFRKHKAPLESEAQVFIDTADKYDIDWRLLPAISVIESSGGRRLPRGSYNAWGWGNAKIRFANWEQAIDTISRALKLKYVDQGLDTPEKMNRKYAASKTWGVRVRAQMNQISPTEQVD